MKVIAFNGSPREKGNNYHALMIMSEVFEKQGIEMEIVNVGQKNIRGCLACNGCLKNKDEKCLIKGDQVNDWIQKMKEADGLIISSPVYFSGVNGTMKSFLDRAFYVIGMNGNMLKQKIGASVAVVRRTGGMPTLNSLNHYLTYTEMIIPTSNYWNVVHGHKPGEVLKDEEGVQTLQVLAENMAYLLKENLRQDSPISARKIYTNFIR